MKGNQYPGECHWLGQVISYPMWTGALLFTFISDTNTALVVQVEPFEDTINCGITLTFYPLFILTKLNDSEINNYASGNYLSQGGDEVIVWKNHEQLKNIENPLSVLISTLIQQNEENKKDYKLESYHVNEEIIRFSSNDIIMTT